MKKVCFALTCCILLTLLGIPARAAAPEVEGKSALLMDIATGTVLYEQNAHAKLPPASVTKVMTMLLIMEALDSGSIARTDMVSVSETAAAKGGSQIYLKVGEQMSVEELLKSIAVSSANDAACAMAEHLAGSESAFVDKMNERAAQLGMADTHFVNCTGLDDGADAQEHLTSAYDIALMSRELMKNHPDIQKYTTIWMDTVRNGAFGLSNTNKLIRFYPGATGLKTGFTASAGYCLSATAQREGLGLIAVILGAETSSIRFAGCKQLLDYGFANYALVAPQTEGDSKVPVVLGTATDVTVIPVEQKQLLIDKQQRGSVTTEITLEESVQAPVSQGQRLGTMTVRCGQQILAQIPMVAREPVARLTWGQVFGQVLRKLLMCGGGAV